MPENVNEIINKVFILLVLAGTVFLMVRIIAKLVKNKYAPVKSVNAQVIDKYKTEVFSKYQGTGKSEKYIIVFMAEGKKRSFYVSEFSYGGYRLKETGTLKYKGDRLIDFS